MAMPTFEESFCAAEQQAFSFLVDEHGFRAVERQVARRSAQDGVSGHVVYRSLGSAQELERAVSLSIAPLRLELDLHISRGKSGVYAIEELHALDGQGVFPRRQHGLYDAMHDPEQLLAEFTRLAGVLRASGARFFNDEPDLWEGLEDQRARRAEDEAIKQTLALSQEVFRARDWPRVIDLLSPIEFRLGRAASARLTYAKRKVRGGV